VALPTALRIAGCQTDKEARRPVLDNRPRAALVPAQGHPPRRVAATRSGTNESTARDGYVGIEGEPNGFSAEV
jgi:hypothetical protein